MKALKRPMFRMGGPIKEGIMDGMKEPQAINTVGSPLAPTDSSGRQGYAFPIIPALIAAGQAGIRALPAVYRGIRMAGTPRSPGAGGFFRNLFPTARFRNVPARKGKDPSPDFIKGDPSAFPGSASTPARTMSFKEAFKDPTTLGRAIRENPFTAFTLASSVPQATFLAGKGLVGAAKATPGLLKGYVEAVLPGKQFDDKDPKTTETDDTGLQVVDKFGENQKGGEAVSQEVKDNLTKDRIEENRKRYYKLMGIDKMKKDATYDSLIDASRIIQEQGGDLKGAVKSGTLQNAIIQAISKNLDKSADLKKQIDAAILKGEIEKDIKSADTLESDYKRARIKALNRAEEAASAKGKINEKYAEEGTISGQTTASYLDQDGLLKPDDVVIPDKEFLKFKKTNPGADEIDYFKAVGGRLENGRYVVGSRLIELRDGQIKIII